MEIQEARGLARVYSHEIEPLVRKGLVRKVDGGWVSTWAARLLAKTNPAALGIPVPDAPLLPGIDMRDEVVAPPTPVPIEVLVDRPFLMTATTSNQTEAA